MAGKYYTARKEVMKQLRAGMQATVDDTVRYALADAQANAPEDTGGLIASSYTVTGDEGSGYDAAVFTAQSLNPKLKPLQSVELDKQALHATALCTFAADYATFIENGYFNVRARRHMAGNPFMEPAAIRARALMWERAGAVLESLGEIEVVTPEQRKEARIESNRRAELRRAQRDVNAAKLSFSEAVLEISGEKLKRLRFANGTFETMGEMWERVYNAAAHASQFDR